MSGAAPGGDGRDSQAGNRGYPGVSPVPGAGTHKIKQFLRTSRERKPLVSARMRRGLLV